MASGPGVAFLQPLDPGLDTWKRFLEAIADYFFVLNSYDVFFFQNFIFSRPMGQNSLWEEEVRQLTLLSEKKTKFGA